MDRFTPTAKLRMSCASCQCHSQISRIGIRSLSFANFFFILHNAYKKPRQAHSKSNCGERFGSTEFSESSLLSSLMQLTRDPFKVRLVNWGEKIKGEIIQIHHVHDSFYWFKSLIFDNNKVNTRPSIMFAQGSTIFTTSRVIYSVKFDVAPKAPDCETDVTESAFGHCYWRCYRCV